MKPLKAIAITFLGLATALSVSEASLRLLGDALPASSRWPSAAAELKDTQLNFDNDYDVIFLGSSVTEAAINPGLLSERSYNAALPFSTPISNKMWLEHEFGVLKNSLVILGVPAWPFHGSFADDPLAGGIEFAADPSHSVLEGLALYQFRGVLSDWFLRRSRILTVRSGSWTDRGHQTSYYERSGDTLEGRFPPYGAPQLSSDHLSAIKEITALVAQRGGTLILMVEPGRYPGRVSSEAVSQYLTSLSALASELDIEFWDTYSVGWDPDLYADEAHFNEAGTVLFTDFIAKLLSRVVADSASTGPATQAP